MSVGSEQMAEALKRAQEVRPETIVLEYKKSMKPSLKT